MSDLKAQIQFESHQAARLSRDRFSCGERVMVPPKQLLLKHLIVKKKTSY